MQISRIAFHTNHIGDDCQVIHATLPDDGEAMVPKKYVIGQRGVTFAEAARNSEIGKGPRKPRPKIIGIAPMCHMSLVRLIEAGKFPPALRIGKNKVAWKASALRAWIAECEAASSGKTGTSKPSKATAQKLR